METFAFASSSSLDLPVSVKMYVSKQLSKLMDYLLNT